MISSCAPRQSARLRRVGRRLSLDDAHPGSRAQRVAQRWASAIRLRTLGEKRRPEGGWPGTLSEARFLVDEQLLPGLGVDCLAEFVLVDRENVARFLHRSARVWWTQLNRDVREVE